MPRQSAENRAGAAFRAGVVRREPPAHLAPAEAEIWRAVVAARPADYFTDGNFEILEQFCCFMVVQRKNLALLRKGKRRDSMGKSYSAEAREMAHTIATLATKLRITIQSSVRPDSGKLTEAATGEVNRLLGGAAVWGEDAKLLKN